ncbi:MAG: sensor histidine kinase [Candidatus Geothermincolia bacterium]
MTRTKRDPLGEPERGRGGRSLRGILLARLGLLAAFTAVATALLVALPVRDNLLDLEKDRLKGAASIFAQALAEPVAAGDVDGIREAAAHLAATSTDLNLTVISSDGVPLADSRQDPGELGNQAYYPEVAIALKGETAASMRESRAAGGYSLFAAAPIWVDGSIPAVARASKAESEVTPLILRVWWIFLGALAFMLAGLVAVSAWIGDTIRHDLAPMREAALELASGALDRRMPRPELRDLAALADATNVMAARVESQLVMAEDEKRKLETVLGGISAGILVTDEETNILLMNGAAARIMRCEPGSCAGKRLIEVFPSHELDLAVARAAQGEAVSEEHRLVYPARLTLRIQATPVYRDNRLTATVSVLEDVTSLRRLERVRSDFVANVSHELRTPVASVKALTDSLQGGALQEPEIAGQFLARLDLEVARLAQLVEDLLALSRLEAEEVRPYLESVRVPELVEENVSSKLALAASYGVSIEVDLHYQGELRGDRRLLDTVLSNLLDNAIKYNREGGSVRVSALRSGDIVEVAVEDSGIGIPEEDRPRIFERFYRVDKARSRETGGTGLGLAIVKHVAEALGGRISVVSEEGRGSRFSLCLPAA